MLHGSSSSSSSSLLLSSTKFPLPGVRPDPFATVAPLIVGVVCRDGVLLLALHTAFAEDNDESILLFSDDDLDQNEDTKQTIPIGDSNSEKQHEVVLQPQQPTLPKQDDKDNTPFDPITTTTTTTTTTTIPPRPYTSKDLPRQYRGPFRIYSLDAAMTTAMACAGWRADGQRLVSYLQSVDAKEIQLFGSSSSTGSDDDVEEDETTIRMTLSHAMEYGTFLASSASNYMATLCVNRSMRPLSTVALLASMDGGLWLLDATGYFRVRAHAVGEGSGPVNEMLLREQDWTQYSCEDVARELFGAMFDEFRANHNDGTQDDQQARRVLKLDVPEGTLVEMATLGSKKNGSTCRPLTRILSSDLFGVAR